MCLCLPPCPGGVLPSSRRSGILQELVRRRAHGEEETAGASGPADPQKNKMDKQTQDKYRERERDRDMRRGGFKV